MRRNFLKQLLGACMLASLLLCLCAGATAETFTLSMVGDCTVGDQWIHHGYKSTFTYKTTQNGLDYPFSGAADLFAQDDLTLANCEGVLTDRRPGPKAKFMTLGAESYFAEVFKLGNVDVCNMANNHAKDFGNKSMEDTAASLNAFGIGAFGDDLTYEAEFSGVRIGFVGYSYPHTEEKFSRYVKAIEQLKADGCTFVIASAHWGKEEGYNINQQQRVYGPALIDAGADLVFGHGSHTLQPVQVYKGKLIFYSMSNFVFGANAAPKDADTAVFQVVFDKHEDGTMTPVSLTALPYKMHNNKDFRPYEVTEEEERLKIWKKLVFTKSKDPDSCLPESFLTTGYADLRDIVAAQTEK